MLKIIAPQEAARLLREGAALVDVREPDEHARERIEGARNLPLSQLEATELAVPVGKSAGLPVSMQLVGRFFEDFIDRFRASRGHA